MFGENLAGLVMLYARPVSAISRIMDRGKLWFAIVAALAVSVAVHMPGMRVSPKAARITPEQRAEMVQRWAAARQERLAHPNAPLPPMEPEDEIDTERVPFALDFFGGAIASWIGLAPGGFIAPLGALAIAFIPAIVFVRAATGFGSFSVLMRRDYLALLMCMLFVWAAAYLPAAVIGIATGVGPAAIVVCAACALYFAVLAALGLRTMLGIDFAPALGLAVIGCIGGVLGLGVYEVAGALRGYVMSPFLLYYAYMLFASDVRSLGDGLRSRQHLRQQLEISTNNPRDADAHYQLGLIYQGRRQFSEAISRFKRAVEIDPKEGDPHYQLGRIAREQKRVDEAIAHLETAVKLDDKLAQSDVWRELGAAYFEAGRTAEAAAALEKFTDRRPYDPEGLVWYGRVLAQEGRQGEAREVLQRAIEAARTMPSHRRAEVRQWGRAAKSELGKVG